MFCSSLFPWYSSIALVWVGKPYTKLLQIPPARNIPSLHHVPFQAQQVSNQCWEKSSEGQGKNQLVSPSERLKPLPAGLPDNTQSGTEMQKLPYPPLLARLCSAEASRTCNEIKEESSFSTNIQELQCFRGNPFLLHLARMGSAALKGHSASTEQLG